MGNMKDLIRQFVEENADRPQFIKSDFKEWYFFKVVGVSSASTLQNNFYFFKRMLEIFMVKNSNGVFSFNWDKIKKLYVDDPKVLEKVLKKAGVKK